VSAIKTQWQPLGEVFSSSALVGHRDIAFYTTPLNPQLGNLIEVIVQDGFAVEVQVWPANCGLRVPPYVTIWCFQGQECLIPFSEPGNFGSFSPKQGYASGLWSDATVRIVVVGESASYNIRSLVGQSACGPINPADTPFCSAAGISGSAFGLSTSFAAKDSFSQQFYNQLVQSFSQGTSACVELTPTCKQYLSQFACQESLRSCSGSGQVQHQTYSLCVNIVNECGQLWENVGLPQFNCEHNFYQGGILWVSASDSDTVTPPSTAVAAPVNLTWLWVVLAILGLIILVVIVFVVIRFVLPRFYLSPAVLLSDTNGVEMKADENPYVTL